MLVLPGPDDTVARRLRRKVRMMALRHLLTVRSRGPLSDALTTLLRTKPDVLLDAVGDLDVLVPLLASVSGALPASPALDLAVPTLLTRLSPELPAPVTWPRPVEMIAGRRPDEALKTLVAGPTGVSVEASTGRHLALTDLEPAPAPRPLRRGELALTDSNPLADVEAHPDKAGNALDLGGRDPDAWVAALDDALAVIEAVLPDLFEELDVTLLRVVPVGYEPERHLSASYREAPGLIYVTLHPDPLTMAEAIVHETQHGKLNLLTWLDPVLHNGHTEWSPSPVRPDLRPLMGVLLAAHAFVPVAALHRALAGAAHPLGQTDAFAQRRAEVLVANADALATLRAKAEPTPAGERVLAALNDLHEELLSGSA